MRSTTVFGRGRFNSTYSAVEGLVAQGEVTRVCSEDDPVVYSLSAHVVFVPKYRRAAFDRVCVEA